MNGVPEAVGTGVSKLVDINPAIGIFVGCLIMAIVAVAKWGLDGWKAKREADKYHSDFVEKLFVEEQKNTERLDRMVLDSQPGGGARARK